MFSAIYRGHLSHLKRKTALIRKGTFNGQTLGKGEVWAQFENEGWTRFQREDFVKTKIAVLLHKQEKTDEA
jgi:hypothetical protein